MSDSDATMKFPDPDEFLDAFKAEMRESADPRPEFEFRCGVCGVDLSPRNRDGRCRWGTDGFHEWKKARMVHGCACEPRGDAPRSACICAAEPMSTLDVDAVVAQMVR